MLQVVIGSDFSVFFDLNKESMPAIKEVSNMEKLGEP